MIIRNDHEIERREVRYGLSEEDIESISDRLLTKMQNDIVNKVALQVEERLYIQVGKTFLNKLLQLLGITVLGIFLYLNGKGFIKLN